MEIFLEGEGPYSRRLYGPPPPEALEGRVDIGRIDEERRRRARSHEHLLMAGVTTAAPEQNQHEVSLRLVHSIAANSAYYCAPRISLLH